MRPIAQADRHYSPWLVDELVPSKTAMLKDVVVGAEDAVGEPVVADELPDVFNRVEFRAFGRQRDERDVRRHDELVGQVPSGLVEDEHGVSAWRHRHRDLGQMQVHRGDVAAGQDEGGGLAVLGADGAGDIGSGVALIVRPRGSRAAPGPAPGDLVLLPDPGLVGKPDLYRGRIDRLVTRELVHNLGEAFLKSSIEPSAWA